MMIIFVVGKVAVVDQNNSCRLLGCDVVFSDLCECEPNRNDDDNKESIRWLTGHHHLLLLIPPRLSHSSPLQLIHQSVITKISLLTFTSEQNQAGSITKLVPEILHHHHPTVSSLTHTCHHSLDAIQRYFLLDLKFRSHTHT